MFRDVIQQLDNEISAERALQHLTNVSQYHRVPASPGFRAAAFYVRDQLWAAGLPAETLVFPANRQTRYWGIRMFQEWEAREGTLDLITGDGPDVRIADHNEQRHSVIQRSSSFKGKLELVAVEGGAEDVDYQGIDVSGKMIIADSPPPRVAEMAIRRRGALGIIHDGMRQEASISGRAELPDAIQDVWFWGRGNAVPSPNETAPLVGFSISPRRGEELREKIKKRAQEGKPPLCVRVNTLCSHYDGTIEVLSTLVPGQGPQEVVAMAHLCHPQPSANDNASGAAALLEACLAVSSLIKEGRLPTPKRGIRFLWLPEMSGTFAYLANHEPDISHMVAGINLDMVGEDQAKCMSTLQLVRPPLSMASFVPVVLEYIQDQYVNGMETHYDRQSFPTLRCTPVPFKGGSDHYIMSDPTVGIPTAELNQHPDFYYHTTFDTIDKVDPRMLGFSANLAAAYSYWLACAGLEETRWLAYEMTARFKQDLIGLIQQGVSAALAGEGESNPNLTAQVKFLVDRQQEALATLKRLADLDIASWQAECAAFGESELSQARERLGDTFRQPPAASGEWESKAATLIPQRIFRGPVSLKNLGLSAADKDELWSLKNRYSKPEYATSILALYWADGRRTLREICDLVELEAGCRPTELLVRYFQILSRAGGLRLTVSDEAFDHLETRSKLHLGLDNSGWPGGRPGVAESY